jgi:hypothetical protein
VWDAADVPSRFKVWIATRDRLGFGSRFGDRPFSESRAARSFRESDRDGLLGGSRAVLSLANMVDFFTNEFACLSRRRLSLAAILSGTF